ncbi:cytochrome c oxidase assembly factor 6 homolog isoform X2 [Dermacentor andersoni]|uniref:cytochrome c oxidase assembly factor 6 homolog isoform X2 n=1 Tax=Dermacentor andersoni TaxID=34620 RepID=UPI002416777D|nr:cytochrome c oxidase assembly factor 6 homolog isoform X2 [Dermacentor andersoni]
MSFPNKEQRQKCWDSRDRYWECLDKNAENANRCTEMKSQYETHCPSQWVKHFNRKREYLQFKDKIENEGRAAGKPTIVFVDPGGRRGRFRAVT